MADLWLSKNPSYLNAGQAALHLEGQNSKAFENLGVQTKA